MMDGLMAFVVVLDKIRGYIDVIFEGKMGWDGACPEYKSEI